MRLFASSIVAVCVVLPSALLGQTTTTTTTNTTSTTTNTGVTILEDIVGRSSNRARDITNFPISKAECDSNIKLSLRLDGLVSDRTQLDVWRGQSCNQASVRNAASNNTCTRLSSLAQPISSNPQFDIKDIAIKDLVPCGTDENNVNYILNFMQASGSEVQGDVSDAKILTIKVDTKLPVAPTDVSVGSGQTDIPVSWTAQPEGPNLIYGYAVYVGSGSCGESGLTEGGSPPTSAKRSEVQGQASTSKNVDIAVSTKADVAVAAIDIARNESVLSKVVCAESVPTLGFIDRYQQAGGDKDFKCTVGWQPTHRSTCFLLGLGVLLGLFYRRRQRVST